MANEAVIIETPKTVVRRTVADGTGFEKGTVMFLSDPNTVSGATLSGQAFGGIAISEKVASDGSTSLGCAMDGVFDLKAAGAAITVGQGVMISGANLIQTVTAAGLIAGALIGYAEETASADEVIRVRLRGN